MSNSIRAPGLPRTNAHGLAHGEPDRTRAARSPFLYILPVVTLAGGLIVECVGEHESFFEEAVANPTRTHVVRY